MKDWQKDLSWGTIFLVVGVGLLTVLLYWWFQGSPYFDDFTDWTAQNKVLLFVALALTQVIALVWPPIPGGVIMIGSIPVLGWLVAYLASLSGVMLGSVIAFLLARRYGQRCLRSLLGQAITHKITSIQIKPAREFESILLLRMLGGGVLIDFVSYAAGLFKLRFWHFFGASLLSHLIIGLPIFYSAGGLFEGNYVSFVLGGVLLVVISVWFWQMKDRYLESL